MVGPRSLHHIHRINFREAQAGQGFQPGEGIAEHPHFFSFLERARAVVHGQFDWAIAFAEEFDEEFEIEVEAIVFQFQAEEAVATEDFEHGERVAQPLKEKHVDQRGEKPMAEIHEEAQAMLAGEAPHLQNFPAAVPRAEHKGAAAADQLFEQGVVVLKVVFEVGVLDEDVITGGGVQAGADGVAFAARLVLEN